MTVLLIITILAAVVGGYCVMGRLDRFLGAGSPTEAARVEQESVVLLFVSGDGGPSAEAALLGKGIPYLSTPEPEVPDGIRVMTVLAFSENDLDNLLLCSKVRHLYPQAGLVARCNDLLYLGIFKETGVRRILTGRLTADEVASAACDASAQGGNL